MESEAAEITPGTLDEEAESADITPGPLEVEAEAADIITGAVEADITSKAFVGVAERAVAAEELAEDESGE